MSFPPTLGIWIGMSVWLVPVGNVFAHGAIHERLLAVSKQIGERPTDARLFVWRADLERQHQDWSAALRDYERARQLDPEMDLDLPLGRTLQESGRAADALPLLNRALEHKSDDPLAMVSRARALIALDRRQEALSDFRKVLGNFPVQDPGLVMECADCLIAEGLEKEALKALSDGIDQLGAVPRLVLRAMDLEIAAHDYNAALFRVAAMQETAPRPEPWMARRATILCEAGRKSESREAWRKLAAHLDALPNLERGSPEISKLMEEAKLALASLEPSTETTVSNTK